MYLLLLITCIYILCNSLEGFLERNLNALNLDFVAPLHLPPPLCLLQELVWAQGRLEEMGATYLLFLITCTYICSNYYI